MKIDSDKIWRRSLKDKAFIKASTMRMSDIKEAPAEAVFNKREIAEAKVALISTAGVVLKSELDYDTKHGDPTFRVIPKNSDYGDIKISHEHYDSTEAKKDLNVIFPLNILKELKAEGFIGEVASNHFGMMGFIPQVDELVNITAPKIGQLLLDDHVDIAILSPG